MRASTASRMPRPTTDRPPTLAENVGALFAGLFGLLLGLGLLKWGNPVILDHLVGLPTTLEEWRVFAWPVRIAYWAAVPVIAVAIATAWVLPPPTQRAPGWLLGLLAGWLLWTAASAWQSIDPGTSRIVLAHFVGCGACFVLGHWILARVAEPRVFWLCLVAAFLAVLAFAAEQRFGGLEATRKMILEGPNAAKLPPEYLARISSNRVFSTLVYPNALAGAILLLLPVAAVMAGRGASRWGPAPARWTPVAVLVAGGCVLVWSGSKAGWLIAMGLILILLFRCRVSGKLKLALVGLLIVGGLVGFAVKFADKLAKGPTSVAARVDYWTAAWQGFMERPLVGQGPGAFKKVYARVKRPESEMAQLAHNDYLQQAVDSGLPAFLAYTGFVWGSLIWLQRRRTWIDDPQHAAVALGLVGWFVQGFVEFGLYLPATSWCAFALLGWLLAQKPSPSST